MKSVAAAAASAVLIASASAADLGKLTVLSALGQPLRAEIELTNAATEDPASIVVKLASFDAHQLANIELTPALQSLRFAIQERGQRRFVSITSPQALKEPSLNLLLELTSNSGRVTREYTFVLDPAERRKTQSAQAAGTRRAAAAGPAKGAEDGTYRVRSGDTLSGIASRIRPSEVSLDMMLVALYRANPDAFIGNNMNRLKSGRVLSVPAASAVRQGVTQAEAREVVVAHAIDFHAYRNKLAGQVAASKPAAAAPASQSAKGRVSARVQEKPTAASASQDQLRLSKATPAKSAKVTEGTSSVDAVAREKEVAQAEARVRELEKNVSELESLMTIKNPTAAQAQQTAKGKDAPAKGAAQAPADKAKAPAKAGTPAAAQPAGADKAEAPAAAQAAAPADPAQSGAPKEKAGLGNTVLAIGAGALALLIAAVAWTRRRKSADAVDETSTGAPSEPSLLGASGAREPSMFADADAADPASDLDHGPFNANLSAGANDADPIAEADVFIAYGREAQAEQVLKDALAADPERHSVRLKLLDLYAGRKDIQAFEDQAREMHRLTDGRGQAWEQAAALGMGLDPLNPLYADAAAAATADSSDLDQVDAGLGADTVTLDKATPEATAPAGDIDDGLDFDLGALSVEPVTRSDDEAPAAPAAAVTDTAAARADFAPAPTPQAQRQASPVDMAGLAKDFEGLPSLPTAAELRGPQSEPIEPEFGLDGLDLGESAPGADTPSQPAAAAPLDLSAFDLDMADNMSMDAAPENTAAAGAAPAAGAESMSAEFMEMETKLDLAMAYQEIGDKEGARELLDEVIKGGNSAQAGKAHAMRERLQ